MGNLSRLICNTQKKTNLKRPPPIRQAFAQGKSDHKKCVLDISVFFAFSKYLQPKPTQTTIFEQVFETRALWTPFEQHFELRDKGAVTEPWATVIVTCLSQGGHPFFEAIFGTLFLKNGAKWKPNWHTKAKEISTKTKLGTRSTNQVC
jgi:hypothetical protein